MVTVGVIIGVLLMLKNTTSYALVSHQRILILCLHTLQRFTFVDTVELKMKWNL